MSISLMRWNCSECSDVVISDPFQHHTMDWCKCDRAGVDLETYMCRYSGNVENIKKIPRNFEKERLVQFWTTYGKNNEFTEGKKVSVSEMTKGHMNAIIETENPGSKTKWLIKREIKWRENVKKS